jgi:hypothetical protein
MTKNSSNDSDKRKLNIDATELEKRIQEGFAKEVDFFNSLPKKFKPGEGVIFTPDLEDKHAD